MSARRTAAITLRLLRQARRDPFTLSLLFITPVFILGLFYFLIRHQNPPPALDVINLDRGPVGTAMATALYRSSTTAAAPAANAAIAEQRLIDGRTAGYVVFPLDFSRNAEQGELTPMVRLDGSDPAAGAQIMGTLVEVGSVAGASLRQSPVIRLHPQVSYAYGSGSIDALDQFGGGFIMFLLFFLVFTITSIAFLRERTQGTLERLLATGVRRMEVVGGYVMAYMSLGLVQVTELLAFGLLLLKLHNHGSAALIFLVEVVVALSAVNLGVLVGVRARTEFQAMQAIPIVFGPQLLLSGLIFAIRAEPGWLQVASGFMPMTYAVDAVRRVMIKGAGLQSHALQQDLAALIVFCTLMGVLAAVSLRRTVA